MMVYNIDDTMMKIRYDALVNVKWSMKGRQLSNAEAGNKLITNIPLLKQFDIADQFIIYLNPK